MRPRGQRSRSRIWPSLAVLFLLAPPLLGQAPPPPGEAETRLGAPSRLAPVQAPVLIEVPAGTTLFREPALDGGMLLTLDAVTSLELLEPGDGAWVRVRYGNYRGWVVLYPERQAVPLPARARPPRGADPERLARARDLLGEGAVESELGPYRMYTDVERRKLLDAVATLVEQLPMLYRSRYGLEVGEPEGEALVLFADEGDYRTYSAAESSISRLETAGHAAPGLAVLFVGERRSEEVLAVLVHELVHLLNRRAFAGELPPWLEEGLAEDLAFSRIDLGGRIEPGTFGGQRRISRFDERLADGRRRVTTNVEVRGPRASLQHLFGLWSRGEAPSLEGVVDLPWAAFVTPEDRDLRYTMGACLVRYLLDGEEGSRAPAFKRYLTTANGATPFPYRELLRALELEALELEEGFWSFVGRHADRRFRD